MKHYPYSRFNKLGGPYSAEITPCMAKYLTVDLILRGVEAKELTSKRPGRTWEVVNF